MIETKEGTLEEMEVLKYFGWQATRSEKRGGRIKHTYVIYARETNIANYADLVKYEIAYDKAKSEIKEEPIIEYSTFLLLLVLFIFPGVLYMVNMKRSIKNVRENNLECTKRMDIALNNAIRLQEKAE